MGSGKREPFFFSSFSFKTYQEAPNRQADWLERRANIYMYSMNVCVSLSLHGSK